MLATNLFLTLVCRVVQVNKIRMYAASRCSNMTGSITNEFGFFVSISSCDWFNVLGGPCSSCCSDIWALIGSLQCVLRLVLFRYTWGLYPWKMKAGYLNPIGHAQHLTTMIKKRSMKCDHKANYSRPSTGGEQMETRATDPPVDLWWSIVTNDSGTLTCHRKARGVRE